MPGRQVAIARGALLRAEACCAGRQFRVALVLHRIAEVGCALQRRAADDGVAGGAWQAFALAYLDVARRACTLDVGGAALTIGPRPLGVANRHRAPVQRGAEEERPARIDSKIRTAGLRCAARLSDARLASLLRTGVPAESSVHVAIRSAACCGRARTAARYKRSGEQRKQEGDASKGGHHAQESTLP